MHEPYDLPHMQRREIVRVMATIAGQAIRATVHIVTLVTQTALAATLFKLLQRILCRMAGVTRQALVRSLQ